MYWDTMDKLPVLMMYVRMCFGLVYSEALNNNI
jgi:hypothetical protein